MAFFGGLDTLGRVEDPLRALGSRVQVASLLDLAGMKMRVLQMRQAGRTTWTFTRSCRAESIYQPGWQPRTRSAGDSILRQASGHCNSMATGRLLAYRTRCGGI